MLKKERFQGRNSTGLLDVPLAQVIVGCVLLVIDVVTKQLWRSRGLGLCNEGVAYGVTGEVLSAASWIVLLMIGVLWWKQRRVELLSGHGSGSLFSWGLVLIFSGGCANQFSRIMYGCVWDWIELGIGGLSGNIADVAIDGGLVLCILGILNGSKQKKNNA